MAYDAEKQKLRELAFWILPQLTCWFCKEPMMDERAAIRQGFGHRRHTAVVDLITFHHEDEDREHNKIANVKIAHPTCHKKHHKARREEAGEGGTSGSEEQG